MTAPAITLSDHRAVHDAKCGRLQRGGGLVKCGQGEGAYEKGSCFADVLYGRPLAISLAHQLFETSSPKDLYQFAYILITPLRSVPKMGRVVGEMRTEGRGIKRGHFCGRPLWTTPKPWSRPMLSSVYSYILAEHP